MSVTKADLIEALKSLIFTDTKMREALSNYTSGLHRLAIQGDEQAISNDPSRGFFMSANTLFGGHDDTGLVPADQLWVNTLNGTTYAELRRPAGVGNVRLYSKMAFRYPHVTFYASFPSLAVPGDATGHYLGLENGGSAPIGLSMFYHRFSGGVDELHAHCNNQNYLITALAPANWMTAPHFWEIKVNRLSVDFLCDGGLLAVIASDRDLRPTSQLGYYYAVRTGASGTNRGQSSVYAVFIGIESGSGAINWPVSKIFFTIVETDPDKPRIYNLMYLSSLAGGATSTLANILPIIAGRSFALTVALTYSGAATAGSTVHLRTSYNGEWYDTEDWDSWSPTGFVAGATIRQTEIYDTDANFVKPLIENLDPVNAITAIMVTATVIG